MIYDLPTSVKVCGIEYNIRSDYRAVLDICIALTDPELSDQDKGAVALSIFYPDLEKIPPENLEDALKQCFWFINCGEENHTQKGPKLVDWGQDFKLIVAPVNRVMGTEIRALGYLHWWTWVCAYQEIGECTFAQVVRIRDRKARGKALDKSDKEWYRKNRHLVDFKAHYTQAEDDALKQWTGQKNPAP